MGKTIFITGASRGFGKLWAEAFLKRGDQVAGTARNTEALKDLAKYGKNFLPISLDVNSREQSFAAINKTREHFGSIDVVINNAGYGLFGTIEEVTEQEARNQFETNVLGLLWITQAAIPVMRSQGKGHIIQLSSVLGVATLPVLGLYNASKWAVEGLSETLQTEVKQFGINVTILEPNGFSTDFGGASAVQSKPLKEYDKTRADFQAGLTDDIYGVPEATTEAVLKLIDSENPPLRLFLGKVAYPWVNKVYTERLATWDEWKQVAADAHGK